MTRMEKYAERRRSIKFTQPTHHKFGDSVCEQCRHCIYEEPASDDPGGYYCNNEMENFSSDEGCYLHEKRPE